MHRSATLAILLALAPSLVLAQERDPASRQAIVDLAYVLGQAHAVTQVCNPSDQHWRSHMLAMVETEGSDHAFAERLRSQFNTGFVSSQSQFTACTPEAKNAEAQIAAKGAALSRRISQARVEQPPTDGLAPP